MKKSALRRLSVHRPDLAQEVFGQTNYRLGRQTRQDQCQIDLYNSAALATVKRADLQVASEICDHCGRHKVGLVDQVAVCPVALGLRIVRLHIAGYRPVLYRPTIVNELIRLSEVGS